MNGMMMMIPAGGAVKLNLDRRLMKLAINAAGSRLSISTHHLIVNRENTHGEARNVSKRRKNRALYLTCKTSASKRPYNRL